MVPLKTDRSSTSRCATIKCDQSNVVRCMIHYFDFTALTHMYDIILLLQADGCNSFRFPPALVSMQSSLSTEKFIDRCVFHDVIICSFFFLLSMMVCMKNNIGSSVLKGIAPTIFKYDGWIHTDTFGVYGDLYAMAIF